MPYLTDLANSLILLGNFVVMPALTYGSQLALGALDARHALLRDLSGDKDLALAFRAADPHLDL